MLKNRGRAAALHLPKAVHRIRAEQPHGKLTVAVLKQGKKNNFLLKIEG